MFDIYNTPARFYGRHSDADKTVAWTGTDTEELLCEHRKKPDSLQKLQELGFDSNYCITYKYNSFGFRDDEFDNRPSAIALGCSFTEGVGIPHDATWPIQLSKLLGMHVWNLGVGGSSCDTAFNMLEYYIDKLNAKYVILCAPCKYRFELYSNRDGHDGPIQIMANLERVIPEQYRAFAKEWMLADSNAEINYRKNILAMNQLCTERNIPFVWGATENDFICDGKGRDLAHPGIDANLDYARRMYIKIQECSRS